MYRVSNSGFRASNIFKHWLKVQDVNDRPPALAPEPSQRLNVRSLRQACFLKPGRQGVAGSWEKNPKLMKLAHVAASSAGFVEQASYFSSRVPGKHATRDNFFLGTFDLRSRSSFQNLNLPPYYFCTSPHHNILFSKFQTYSLI